MDSPRKIGQAPKWIGHGRASQYRNLNTHFHTISKAMINADDIISATQELDIQMAALVKKAKPPCAPTCVHQKTTTPKRKIALTNTGG